MYSSHIAVNQHILKSFSSYVNRLFVVILLNSVDVYRTYCDHSVNLKLNQLLDKFLCHAIYRFCSTYAIRIIFIKIH